MVAQAAIVIVVNVGRVVVDGEEGFGVWVVGYELWVVGCGL